VRMDQPYSRLADMALEHSITVRAIRGSYDDTGWTLGACVTSRPRASPISPFSALPCKK